MSLALKIVGALFLLAAIYGHKDRRSITVFLVGFLAAFDQLQTVSLHLFSVACLLTIVIDRRPALRSDRRLWFAITLVVAAAALASSVLFGSLVTHPVIGLQLLVLAFSAALIIYSFTHADIRVASIGLVCGITFTAIIALLQTVHALPPNYFIDSSGIPRVHSLYREPDFMATYLAVGLVVSIRLIKSRFLQISLTALFGMLLFLSYARGAWIGLLVSALVCYVARRIPGLVSPSVISRRNRVLVAGAITGFSFVVAIDRSARDTAITRLVNLSGSTYDPSFEARTSQLAALHQLASEAPWHGFGLSAAGRVTGLGLIDYGNSTTNHVATNWFYDWWIGGKILAIPLIAFFTLITVFAIRSIAGQCLLLILLNSLVSNSVMLPVTWLMLGLAVAGHPYVRRAHHRVISSHRARRSTPSSAQVADHEVISYVPQPKSHRKRFAGSPTS